ncbi:GntR family transcriptional regulator [Kocuria flava]|uniref:GntR family transcriptional regulator n=1 Tax=Kocuria flava TaxID=446860 RepID=UPI001FF4C24F|nr:GntR family transcriptional regulator [Kocuria flava]MCJ8504572.1 GntR family transcriptional regulator [Kocuria flava]
MNAVDDSALAAAAAQAGPAPSGEATPWAAAVLRGTITAGRLLPGTRLSEAQVSRVLGISRNTLREAFAALADENLLTRLPHRGVSVARPGPEDVREMYRVRLALETSALRWTEPGPAPQLHAAVAAGRAARERGDVAATADANQRFHRAVVALAGSSRQDELMDRILAEMRLVFLGMREDPSFHMPFVERNDRITALFEAGRSQEAAAEMAAYLAAGRDRVLAALGAPARA